MKFIKIATSPNTGISLFARLSRPNAHTHYSYDFGASVGGSQIVPVDTSFFHDFWYEVNRGRVQLSPQQERIFSAISRRNGGYGSATPTTYLETLCRAFKSGNVRMIEIQLECWKDYTRF